MTSIDLMQYKNGDEIELTVRVLAVVKRENEFGALVLSTNGVQGATLWEDGKVTGLPDHCLPVLEVKHYTPPAPATGTVYRHNLTGAILMKLQEGWRLTSVDGSSNLLNSVSEDALHYYTRLDGQA